MDFADSISHTDFILKTGRWHDNECVLGVKSVAVLNLARILAGASVSPKGVFVSRSHRTFAVVVRLISAKMTELRHRGARDSDPTLQQQPSEDKVSPDR